ncbi:MAG: 16S rRNA (cytidine(1402)-2'-O)-methyltransferase [Candidatus Parabeggiatoa sp. nov. 2]|nr:MAG: 16S rRNA (cytidine(1402)-2'-O)-methyltransferase [Gammaproteobacteria bacterium]
MVSIEKGTLYVVATPIGNLQDFSPRAQSVLRQVNLIAAEDTRHSRHLLNHFSITTPLQSLHEHNERQIAHNLLQRLHNDDNIALISDAGTPLISDPGYYLIQTALAEQITVVPIPGPSALISALSVAGFPADRFVFEGFLPAKAAARRQRLEILVEESRTLVFYEAPHRLVDCVNDMAQIFGEARQAVLVKELTKVFETVYRDTLSGIVNWLMARAERQKGEFVLVVQGAPKPDNNALNPEAERVFQLLRKDLSLKLAAKLASEITGVSKNRLYALGLEK